MSFGYFMHILQRYPAELILNLSLITRWTNAIFANLGPIKMVARQSITSSGRSSVLVGCGYKDELKYR